jgi:hypothetical protein
MVKICKFIKINAVSLKESTPRYTYLSPGVVLPHDATLIWPDTSRLGEQSSRQGFL